jgi:hypothetical protein
MGMARVGVLFDRASAEARHRDGINTFEMYIGEIMAHAGLPFHWLDGVAQVRRESLDIVVVALGPDDEMTAQHLWQFAAQGGGLIVLTPVAALTGKLGWTLGEAVGVGYAALPGLPPLRSLGATPINTSAAGTPGESMGQLFADRPDGTMLGTAIMRARVGAGVVECWTVNPAVTVVALQQGLAPVTQDGVPAPDGSGALDEGILKADDGFALDWVLDRRTTPTGQPYFAHPYADLWREVFVGHLLRMSVGLGLRLPFIDYWPDGVRSVATISHDSDLNDNDSAITTLGLLAEMGVHSTWCMLEPGYAPEVYPQITAHGHELAFHYNSVVHENYHWGADDFKRQFDWMVAATGIQAVTSNKNHYTRFENWGDLFRWLEGVGIQLDQTRGPSKRGNVGMLFGTCHPFWPVAWHDEGNRLYDVLELGFLTQDIDLGSWADSSVIVPFLEQVQAVRGVAHFLFHPIHLHQQESVRQAFRSVIREAHSRGFTFWTSKQINDWTRARRTLRVELMGAKGRAILNRPWRVGDPPQPVAVWAPMLPGEQVPDGQSTNERFGVLCCKCEVGVLV